MSFSRLRMALLGVVAATAIGCSSSDGNQASAATLDPDGGAAPVFHADRTFTVDDFIAAGWKRSKEIPADTLPAAEAVWYGFHDKKDFELRFYPSHEAVIEHGTGPADETTGRGKPEFHQGGIHVTRTSYGAYVVAGNVVVLCESLVIECEALAANLR